MTTLFGGNPNVSHFQVQVRYVLPSERWSTGTQEAQRNAPARRREQVRILKDLGFPTRYFQFHNNDPVSKKDAQSKAKAFLHEWEAKVNFELEIVEGCFL